MKSDDGLTSIIETEISACNESADGHFEVNLKEKAIEPIERVNWVYFVNDAFTLAFSWFFAAFLEQSFENEHERP